MRKVALAVWVFGLLAATAHANDTERERLAIEREKLEMERQRMQWEREREARQLRCETMDYACTQRAQSACERLGGRWVHGGFGRPMLCELPPPEKEACERAGGHWLPNLGWCQKKAS